MASPLESMSLQELWQLFPIELVAPTLERWSAWHTQFERMKAVIERSPVAPLRVSHIGSTAIDHIWAKNIVDILVEMKAHEPRNLATMSRYLQQQGLLVMSTTATRISLNLGYTEQGFADEVFHVHLRIEGDNDELYFRDYLNAHPAEAHAYEQSKVALAPRFRNDRDGYTGAKSEFVRSMTQLGKREFPERYAPDER